MSNNLLLRTIKGESVERPPVWLMRQAGRILPEYREVRASVPNFISLVKNPELAAEVSLQPVDILDVDAAIIFSDILVIPECMGLPYKLIEKKGPFFPKTIESDADIDNLNFGENAVQSLDYVYEAVELLKTRLNGRVPLIGFSGAPWTLMSYMIEGQGSKTFSKAKALLYKNPSSAHRLLDKITNTIIEYLLLKIKAGADVVQIFDSWAGVLNNYLYKEFCIPYLKRIIDSINEVPVILFARGAQYSFDELHDLGADVIGLDWTVDPREYRMHNSRSQLVQGNMDPCVLYGSKETIESRAKSIIESFQNKHIFNLGHGVYPDTPLDNVKRLINYIKDYRY